MKAEILRTYLEQETLSTLNILDDKNQIVFTCKGLEPPNKGNQHNISCIAEGQYKVVKEETSIGHTYPHFRVLNVPGRNGILWHAGNYYYDTLGCLLIGDSFKDRNQDGIIDVINSRDTLQKLYDIMPDEFFVTYKQKSQ